MVGVIPVKFYRPQINVDVDEGFRDMSYKKFIYLLLRNRCWISSFVCDLSVGLVQLSSNIAWILSSCSGRFIITTALPLSAGRITIDSSFFKLFKAFSSSVLMFLFCGVFALFRMLVIDKRISCFFRLFQIINS